MLTRYIEAREGSEFAIDIDVDKGFDFGVADNLEITFFVDGKQMDVWVLYASQCKLAGHHSSLRGARIHDGSKWFLRQFRFNELRQGVSLLAPQLGKSTDHSRWQHESQRRVNRESQEQDWYH